jgi:hypothetical protein
MIYKVVYGEKDIGLDHIHQQKESFFYNAYYSYNRYIQVYAYGVEILALETP